MHGLRRVRDGPERRHGALFVGRERELALVREAWERVRAEQRCELVTVVGDVVGAFIPIVRDVP